MVDRFNENISRQAPAQSCSPPSHCACGEFTDVALMRITNPKYGTCYAPASGVMYQDKSGWHMKNEFIFAGWAPMCAECFLDHKLKVICTTDDERPKLKDRETQKANFEKFKQGV